MCVCVFECVMVTWEVNWMKSSNHDFTFSAEDFFDQLDPRIATPLKELSGWNEINPHLVIFQESIFVFLGTFQPTLFSLSLSLSKSLQKNRVIDR